MNEIGSVLCNACGLFLKLHGCAHPISLKTDVIKSRNRVKSSGMGRSPKKKASELQMHLSHPGQDKQILAAGQEQGKGS
jgi:GATA-binding protein